MNISVTKKAWQKMSEILRQSKNKFGFLYSASSGGCNGFSFKLGLLDESEHSKISSMKYLTILNESDTDINIDPLNKRIEDIPLLLDYFSKKIAELNGINETKLDTNFDLFYKY